jgi:RNA polymerase sigma-70 factor (ECF subfamily)
MLGPEDHTGEPTPVTRRHGTQSISGEQPLDYGDLVRATRGGDRAAIESLLMRSQEVAYRFSVHVCGRTNDAEDVMQEALLKTFCHAPRIREPNAFRPWLYRTVRNACLMRRRLHLGEPRHFVSLSELRSTEEGGATFEPVDPGPSPDAVLRGARLRSRMRQALAELPPTLRIVVLLREIEGLSTKEVARVLGISEGNVKTRLYRARVHMRERLSVVL